MSRWIRTAVSLRHRGGQDGTPYDAPAARPRVPSRRVALLLAAASTTASLVVLPAAASVSAPLPAALTVGVTPSAANVVAGQQLTWTVAVTDAGPGDAAGPLTLNAALPAGLVYLSSVGLGWSCRVDNGGFLAPGQNVVCTQTSGVPAGTAAPALQVVTQVDPDTPSGTPTTTVNVSSPSPGTPGSGSGSVTVSRAAALTVAKSHQGTAEVGGTANFTLAVHNAGPSTADGIRVTDPLPTGLTYVGASGTGWTCAAATSAGVQTVTCDLTGTLAVGADAPRLTLTTSVGAAAYPSAANTATVSSTDPGLTGSSSGSDTLPVAPSTGLTVSKTHVGDLAVGQPGRYLVSVTPTGPTPTPGPVTVTDTLPAGLTFVRGTGAGWSCAATGQVVTCTRPGALAVGVAAQVALDVAVGASAAPGVTNSAVASAPGAVATTASDTAPVAPLSRLSLVKTLASQHGTDVAYRLVATSAGPNPSTEPVVLRDPGATGLRLTGATGQGWDCGLATGTVTCRYDAPLAPGASAPPVTVTGVLTAAPGTTVRNVASLSGGDPQGVTTPSNPASVVVPVAATPSTPSTPSGPATHPVPTAPILLPVAGPRPPATRPVAGHAPAAHPVTGRLPRTGADLGPQALLGLVLLASGGALVLARRRRA